MHRYQLSLLCSCSFTVIFFVTGCIRKPPVVDFFDDTDDSVVVGTPGSIAFPEKKSWEDDSDSKEPTLDETGGCTNDVQCKGDRVCIAGACVSPQYAEEYEARYMASAGVTEQNEATGNHIIEVQVPPSPNRQVKCRFNRIERCMKKCAAGDLESCYSVGKLYENHPDASRAAEYAEYAYRKACDGGDDFSCILLSRIYFVGVMVERNLAVAFSLNVDACGMKNMYACVNAAVMVENGVGVEANPDLAAEYYTQACILGSDDACAKAKPTDEEFVSE
ncbi:MAG: sel1 repeat family protein [Deltaproteobacteria bacterium]|nr:sel1 repeat family protein [Deltaproteobacteria bacterium]